MIKWIKEFFSLPMMGDDEDATVAFILHSITLWGIPLLLLIVVIRILSGDNRIDATHVFIGVVILTFLASRVALHLGYVRGASRAILLMAWVGVTYLAWDSDGLQNNALIPYMTLILASALLLGEVDTLILSAFCIAAIWGIAYADTTGLRITDSPQDAYDLALNLSVNYFISTVAIYYMIRILRISFNKGRKELIERRQIEKSLRDNEEKFRKVFHSSPVAICITELEDGRLLEANYAYWDLMGLKPEEALGRTSEELKLWDTPSERDEFVEILKARGSYYNPDDSFTDASGKLKRTISFYELIHIGNDERVLSMFYDMSEQRQTMDALKGSEARTRALLGAMPDMLLEITLDGSIINMIPPKGMEESIPAVHFIGRQIREVFSETVAMQTLSAIKQAITADQTNVFEFEENMGGNIRTMEARVIANAPDAVLMMLRDVTQQKWIEGEREDLVKELEIRNRESETLREGLASIVTTFDFKEVMERILDQIKLVIPYNSASVWRNDGEWQTLIVSRDIPPEVPIDELKFKADDNNSSHPIITGEKPFVLSTNVQKELSDFGGVHAYVNSWLAVPLKTKGKVIGLIALDGKHKNQFNEHHAELMVVFADQVAIALENTGLFTDLQAELEQRKDLIEELKAINAEAETLRESTAIVAASLEISETVQRILEQIQRVVQYDSASVWLYRKDRAEMIGSRNLPEGAEGPGYYTPSEKEPDHPFFTDPETPYIVLYDVQANYPQFKREGFDYAHGWMSIPMRARGKLIGFISLDSRLHGKFTERDAELALTFANQVSIALENARLFSDLQTELSIRQNLISELESKNAELERFTYTVSHDLKSPLFTIRGFLGYLEEDAFAGNHERMKSDIQRITDATNKMQQLLNELLELSRVGRMKNESELISFEALVREAVELVQGRIMERGVAIRIDEDMPSVYGDRQRLFEVVQNLVDNAAKFMGDQPDPRIEIGQDGEEDGMPIFHVSDNGIGIPPEHHERIFGLFNKLDVKSDGTGIGLALVKRIIEVHGGRIWVQSATSPQAVSPRRTRGPNGGKRDRVLHSILRCRTPYNMNNSWTGSVYEFSF